jgi:hypothetical protein
MNLLRSQSLAFVSQVDLSVFALKGAKERRPSGFLRLAAALAVLCLGSAGASAATCTVTSTADSGAGTLRSCLLTYAAGDTINLTGTGTITLASALPAIAQNVTIAGPGASQLTISGDGTFKVFSITSGTVTISGLNFSGGSAAGGGAAFSQAGGTVTVTGCEFANNSSSGNGGAISVSSGSLSVSNSVFSGNSAANGAAIYNSTGVLTVRGSTFSGNSATSDGGAIDNDTGATLTVTNSTFATNSAVGGGAIYNAGTTAAVVNSTFFGDSASNDGAGILNDAGTLTAGNNLFVGNTSATAGAGVDNLGTTNANANVYYHNLAGGTEDDCHGCTSTNATLATANPLALPLGNYGGSTQTLLPQPGSEAICAGLAAVATGLTTDQRGYPLHPSGGYCPATNVDAGAVQTNFTSVNFVQQPSTVALGTAMSPAPTVEVLETDTLLNSNNAVSGIPITLMYSGTGALSGNTATTGVSVAIFSTLKVNTIPGTSETLSTSVPVTPSVVTPAKTLTATSADFNVIGPATTLVVSAPPSTTAGVPFSVTVTAQDSAGNIATGYTGTVHFTSTDSGTSVALPASFTFSAVNNGVAPFIVTLVTAGVQTVTATDTVTTTIHGSATVAVGASTPAVLRATSGTPQSTYVRTAFVTPLAASVKDGFGNAVSGATVNFTAPPSSGASATLSGAGSCITGGNGICFVTATANSTPGSYNVTAAVGGFPVAGSVNFALDNIPPPSYLVTAFTDDAGTASNCVDQNFGGGNNSNCGLRDALIAAAANGGANITFAGYLGFGVVNTPLTIPSYTAIQGPPVNGLLEESIFLTAGSTGGVFVVPPTTTGASISNLLIQDGRATGNGGGIQNSGVLTVSSTTILHNGASGSGGGIYNNGTLVVTRSLLQGNISPDDGGGIFNDVGGTLTVTDSTFYDNTAFTGGGIHNNGGGTLTAVNNTFAGNSATYDSGGVYNGGTATFANNIISGNTATNGPNCDGVCPANGANGNLVGGTVNLSPLGFYAGPTGTSIETVIPEPGSPAICAGSLTLASNAGLTTDQRGLPITGGGYCSSGAVDAGAVQTNYTVSFTTNPPPSVTIDQGFGAAVTLDESGGLFTASSANTTLTVSSGTLTGVTTQATSGSTGVATYSGLSYGTAASGFNLSATVSLNPVLATLSLPATSSSFTVTTAPTTTTVSPSTTSSAVDQAVTLTAAISPNVTNPVSAANTVPITGSVTFADNGTTIACNGGTPSATFSSSSGTATAACTTSTLTAGMHSKIIATYGGNAAYQPSPASAPASTVNVALASTSLAVTTNPASPTLNHAVTYIATITFPSPLTVAPTGMTATFVDNGTTISSCGTGNPTITATATPNVYQATCTESSPTGGSHAIVVTYPGDSNYSPSAGNLSVSVASGSATMTITPTPGSPSVVNQPVSFAVTVTGGTTIQITGTVTVVADGTITLGQCTLGNWNSSTGAASCAVSSSSLSLKTSGHAITANYSGDTNYASSNPGASVNYVVNQASTTVSVTSGIPTSTVNQPVTFTAIVTPAITGSTAPTGTLAFTATPASGPVVSICTAAPLTTSGSATCSTTTSLVAGSYTISANYGGDTNFSGNANTVTQTVNKASTAVALGSSANPSGLNHSVTFTATVTPSPSGSVGLSGTVAFTDSVTSAAIAGCSAETLTFSGPVGQATCTTSALAVSPPAHTITATYSNDSNFSGNSSTFVQTVNPTSLQIDLTPPTGTTTTVDQNVTFTSTIPVQSTSPTGKLTFTDNGTTIIGTNNAACSGTPNSNWVSTCIYGKLTAGTHTIVAAYSGDPNVSVVNGTTTMTVNQAASSIALVSSQSPIFTSSSNSTNFEDSVTFTATVSAPAGASIPLNFNSAGGTVAFTGGGITGCSAVAISSSGVATCTTTTLPSGSNTITATYSGDLNYANSSNTAIQIVEDYAISVANVPSGTLGVQVTQGYATGQTTQNASAHVDPFPPSPQPALTSISIGGFATATGEAGIIESCSSSGTGSPVCIIPPPSTTTPATLQITNGGIEPAVGVLIDATGASPGTYTFTVTVMDPTTTIVRTATFPVTVRPATTSIVSSKNVNSGNVLTLNSGATGITVPVTFFGVPAGVTITSLSCPLIAGTGITGSEALNAVGVGCSFSPASLSSSPFTTTVTITTNGTIATATPMKVGNRGSAILVAGLFTLPFFGLMGILRGRKSLGANLFRLIAIAAIGIAAMHTIGCGGGYNGSSTAVTGGTTPPGIYYLEIQGTGSDGNNYQTVLQVNVNL